MLERNGAVFRSEYSAENDCRLGTLSCSNSDLSCGNGYAGSPATNWPCLTDPVGIDRDCFGHGRGNSHSLLLLSNRHALLPVFLLFSHVNIGLVNGLGGGTTPQSNDIPGLVFNIPDIYVNQLKPDFLEFP